MRLLLWCFVVGVLGMRRQLVMARPRVRRFVSEKSRPAIAEKR